MGLATAVNRLKDSKAKSRIIILLTDGVNNSGTIEPETASDIAKEYGIKVYTIGIGTNGTGRISVCVGSERRFYFQYDAGGNRRTIDEKHRQKNRRKIFQGNEQYQARSDL